MHGWSQWWRVLVGVAALHLLMATGPVDAATLLSYLPTNGPISGGTLISIAGDGFITTGNDRSKCSFARQDGRASALSVSNQIHNSTHISCILPDITAFFTSTVPLDGTTVTLAVTAGRNQFSNTFSFLVYDISTITTTAITPNQGPSNSSNGTHIAVSGQGFINTGEISCTLDSHTSTLVPAIFISSTRLECLLPLIQDAIRLQVLISLNGQLVAAIPSLPGVLLFTFYSSAPRVMSSYFSPSYTEIILQFDRETEIGLEEISALTPHIPADNIADLTLECTRVFNSDALRVIGNMASCSWENTQQRAIIIHLTSNSEVRENIVLGIRENSIRTRHVLYSRLASGSVTVTGLDLVPTAVLEAPAIIPMCGRFVASGVKSHNGGARDLEYAWRIGMELDEAGNVIPDPILATYVLPPNFTAQGTWSIPSSAFYFDSMSGSGSGELLAPISTYSVQLTVLNFLGFHSTVMLHNVSTTRQLLPSILIVGEASKRVESWRDILLEGKVLRMANNCAVEFRVSNYSWRVSDEGVDLELGGIRTNSSILLLPPNTLYPGGFYTATLRVAFDTGDSSTASVSLESVEGLEARLEGGVRRALGSNNTLELDGRMSVIHQHPEARVNVTWECLDVAVPELELASSSCDNFTSSEGLVLSLAGGTLPPGGYQFTLTLSLLQRGGVVTLRSSTTQLVVIFPNPVPVINIVTTRNDNFNSILVHRRFSLEAEVLTANTGLLRWTTEYVDGYGQLLLQSNISATPLVYPVCSSLHTCPYTESSINLYTAAVLPPNSAAPLANRVSLVLTNSILLTQNLYRFKLSMVDHLGQQGFAEVDVRTESVPSSGRMEISPQFGSALATVFTLMALGWTDNPGESPFFYRVGFRYFCFNRSADHEEWMTGISQDNEFSFILPEISSELDPRVILQVFDRNGAVRELSRGFSSLLTDPVLIEGAPIAPSQDADPLELIEEIDSMMEQGHWVQAVSHLTSLLTSINMDHGEIICNSSHDLLSTRFRLSNYEFIEFKMRALQLVLELYYCFIPISQSHFQIILSLAQKATKTQCDLRTCEGSQFFHADHERLLSLLENIVILSNRFSEFGVLSRRGISREDAHAVFSIYEQILCAQNGSTPSDSPSGNLPRVRSNQVTESFSRILPHISYGLCLQRTIYERTEDICLNGFMNLKSSHTNLPSDYAAGSCSANSCALDPVRVDFGPELLTLYLQWSCFTEDEARHCSGVCLTSTQLYFDLFWQGNPFSSLIKSPILHMSLLNPSNGATLFTRLSTSQPVLDIPIMLLYSHPSNLVCVTWNESSLVWVNSSCQTEVRHTSSGDSVRCQCSDVGSLFYAVLERCPDGYYGTECNQTCPEDLWGSECSMPCECSNRGLCSPADGSCDCDPGWIGASCNQACVEGVYGKLCSEECQCENGAVCDHVTGDCSCTAGWIGSLCNISCIEGFFGDRCEDLCQCRNISECDFITGSCACQAGFTGSTCHDLCPDGSYGLECGLTCQCLAAGTRSCDHITGSCDCQDMWVGDLCDIQVTQPPTVPIPATFQIWWAIVGVVAAIIVAVGVAIVPIVIVIWRNKRKRKKIAPTEGKEIKREERTTVSRDSTNSLEISRTKSLEVLVPKGGNLTDFFIPSPMAETGAVMEFKEPFEISGAYRWQIVRVLSDVGSEGRKSDLTDQDGGITLDSRESSRPVSKTPNPEPDGSDKDRDTQSHQDQEQTEMVYRGGIYLTADASLKDLRNQFINSEQLEEGDGLHFQFLKSDVPGDRIELDTEDEVLLCQIEESLLQKRTMYIETIDPGIAVGELCVCGKFADLECTSCKKRGYCSRQCQEKDWIHHEEFCREVSSRRERRRRRRKLKSQEKARRSVTPLSEDTCVCGKEAEYECSGCRKQGYCSETCQTEDWNFHEYYCNRPGNSRTTPPRHLSSITPNRMQQNLGKLQTVFEEPESSIDA